jgi:hypothetical protein
VKASGQPRLQIQASATSRLATTWPDGCWPTLEESQGP